MNRFSLNNRYKGATLLELMAMLLVITLALSTFFYTLTQSMSFARDAEARIKAINLAREGIEAMINIRNTNWLRYSSDRKSCWKALNYNRSCIGTGNNSISDGTYILHKEHGLWKLEEQIGTIDWTNQWQSTFKKFQLALDKDGWHIGKLDPATSIVTQISNLPLCKNIYNSPSSGDCKSIFARDITISHTEAHKMTITSTVHWYNGGPRKVSLKMILTNWKRHYDTYN